MPNTTKPSIKVFSEISGREPSENTTVVDLNYNFNPSSPLSRKRVLKNDRQARPPCAKAATLFTVYTRFFPLGRYSSSLSLSRSLLLVAAGARDAGG